MKKSINATFALSGVCVFFLLSVLGGVVACDDSPPSGNPDADGGVDGDLDGNLDADGGVDGDLDGNLDAEGRVNGDLDGNLDAGGDGSVEGIGGLVGMVFAPNKDGFDVVPGAHVWIVDGPETWTDELGRFAFENLESGLTVVINVEGPDADDPSNMRIFSTNQAVATIPTNDSAEVFVNLLQGCVATVDGESGGEVPLVDCGGSGTASLAFGPRAVVTAGGEPFTGQVRVEAAVADPDNDLSWSTVPEGDSGEITVFFGAIEVRLRDARTLEALQVADGESVQVRFEIRDPEAEDQTLEWLDTTTGQWEPGPTGSVVTEGEQVFYEFQASHFTTYGVGTCGGIAYGCVTMTPQLCRGGSCEQIAVTAELFMRGHFSRQRLNFERTCIVVPDAPTTISLRLHTMDPGRNYASAVRVVSVGRMSTAPGCCNGGPRPGRPITCECQDLGDVVLREMRLGCITGTLENESGPMYGRISIRAGGDEISVLRLPGPQTEVCQGDPTLAECNGHFCANLPMSFLIPGTKIEFVDWAGNTVSVEPDRSREGQECGTGFCQDIGSPIPACTAALGCVSAGFVYEVVHNSANCPPERPHELQLDASPSIGPIVTYGWEFELDPEWLASLEDPSNAPSFVPGPFIGPDAQTVSACVEPGYYVVRLNAIGRLPHNTQLLSNFAQQTIRVGDGSAYPGPCACKLSSSNIEGDSFYTYNYNGGRLSTIENLAPTSLLVRRVVEHFDEQGLLVSRETTSTMGRRIMERGTRTSSTGREATVLPEASAVSYVGWSRRGMATFPLCRLLLLRRRSRPTTMSAGGECSRGPRRPARRVTRRTAMDHSLHSFRR